jgi:signal transduction histidine kinase
MQGPRSANIKIVLIALAVLIVVGILIYTRHIVKQLVDRERSIADLYAKSVEFIASPNRPADRPGEQLDYSFIFEEVIRSIDFPMVLSDPHNHPFPPFQTSARNIAFDSTLPLDKQREFFQHVIDELDRQNPPIRVAVQESIVVNYVHYGESELVTKLRWLPYIEFVVGGMFIIMGYIGFSYIKRSEQSNIWVGMAKETAHQLGTPLSSLMGWIEMMKGYAADNPKQLATIRDMENDLQRLHQVTERFSKIGSKPSLKEEDLHEVIDSIIAYFKRRLPTRIGDRANIAIVLDTNDHARAKINRELFGWVIENLIRNALDAMEDGKGSITFSISSRGSAITVDVKDTGKGIDMKQRQDIFRPGYSTKLRGWGLGLSLSKRIIETYHRGKLVVKESKIGKGTTFRIKLDKG